MRTTGIDIIGDAPWGTHFCQFYKSRQDLVLLDLNLPVLSGFEVIKWMRARPELTALPVVVFSSSTLPEDKVKAAELGASEYVEKPPSGAQFGTVVGRLKARWL